MTTGEVPPNENKPWFSLIRGWHYIILSVHWKRKSELITVGDRKTIKLQLVFFFFCCLYSGDVPFELTSCVPTNCANKKLFGMVLWLVSFICCHSTTSLGFRWLKFHCTYLVPICVLDEAGHSSWDSKVNQWGVWLGIEPDGIIPLFGTNMTKSSAAMSLAGRNRSEGLRVARFKETRWCPFLFANHGKTIGKPRKTTGKP